MPKLSALPTNTAPVLTDKVIMIQNSTMTDQQTAIQYILALLAQGGTFLSSQITTYTNGGSAGGTFSYINLGGFKLLWGVTAQINTFGGTPVYSPAVDVNIPTGFFGSAPTALASPYPTFFNTSDAVAAVKLCTATAISVALGFIDGANGEGCVSVIAIGT